MWPLWIWEASVMVHKQSHRVCHRSLRQEESQQTYGCGTFRGLTHPHGSTSRQELGAETATIARPMKD